MVKPMNTNTTKEINLTSVGLVNLNSHNNQENEDYLFLCSILFELPRILCLFKKLKKGEKGIDKGIGKAL